MASGALQIRGADEPYALTNPTRITGTNTDGALSGVAFTTPTVRFVQEVTEPAPATATIEASFSQPAPGTGTVSESGDVTLRLALAVDLHIVVDLLPDPRHCRAAPINVTLSSALPYDPETERVALTATGFTVPAVSLTADPLCDVLVGEAINTTLQGGGHSLTLTMEGPLTLPTLGEPTATSLAVSPLSPARVGAEVTLTATVAPSPAVAGAPAIAGAVAFLDGEEQVGLAEVQSDGTATLVTTELLAGPRRLTARYLGAAPDWDPSTSSVVAYTVVADPAISTDLSGLVEGGGAPMPFGVTVTNTGFGAPLDDAQVQVTIERTTGFAPLGPDVGTPRIVLRHHTEGAVVAVPLAASGSTLTGVIGDASTWAVAPGQEVTAPLDMVASSALGAGRLRLTFTLVDDPDGTPVTLGTTTALVTVVQGDRIATSLIAGDPGLVIPGDPPIVFLPRIDPIVPSVARQGGTVDIYNLQVTPVVSGVQPSGTVTVTVDGRPARIRNAGGKGDPFRDSVIVPSNTPSIAVALPPDIGTGTRQVEVRYSGDALYRPSEVTWPLTVLPSTGSIYECRAQGIYQTTFTTSVEVDATVPPVWATGTDIPLGRVGVDLVASRTTGDVSAVNDVGHPTAATTLRLDVGPGGTVTPSEMVQANTEPMYEDDGLGPDLIISLRRGTGAVPLAAAPGTETRLTLDRIEATSINSDGFAGGIVCLPLAEPAVLGTVVAAGTTLVAEPGEAVGEGSSVTLTATALPATPGAVVEFRDGTETIGVVPVDGVGVARMATRALPAGTRNLTARTFGGVVPTVPSEPVALRVATCGAAVELGDAATVRLVYLELLGRCPDAAGLRYWTDRLDGATTPEVFARSIARTPEAVGRVVDDAYRTMLGRPADASGRAFWTQRLLGHGRYDQLLADLGASPEFWSQAGSSNTEFVTRVYDRLLGRAPDAAGLDYWTGRLAAGASPRVLIRTLANLDEPLGVLVKDSYGEILDRIPDVDERSGGITFLRATGDRSGLYAQLIGTGEFGDRAQTFPNPD